MTPTPPPGGLANRLDYLDGWRGLAIALVLESHFLHWLPLDAGRLGVDVFFALSGFLMSGILFIQRQPLATFYKRRISRIVPAFAIFVIAIYTFATIRGLPFTWVEFLATLTFLRTYIPASPGIWGGVVPISHLWSLNVEEHCYMFMSVLVLLRALRGREGVALLLSGLICIAIAEIYAKLGPTAPRWGGLGTEIAASHLLISGGYRLLSHHIRPLIPAWLPLATLVGAVTCYSSVVPWWSHFLVSPFLLAVTVNHISETGAWFRRVLAVAPLRQLGIWSYSIYLWQQPFFKYAPAIPGGTPAALTIAFAAALVSFYFLERPIRVWLNRNW